ncbi:sulfate permease II [Colletotrichum tofieldiae]|uniref:Sulfate permease II n=1 Tax=Colletotrichum tofieldiae TaxID=708197 RepID=A0A166Z962_9PEZI|nr:sulfate permease II [Colletotrichum tofieldiae]GKT56584.1 sulfate permease II [Colletotrichum tofieldiae]GKT76447.1 sulfate permease II [Colletotrichum tofieldiae]
MRPSSNPLLRASFVAAWLAAAVLAIPQVVDREDPPPSPPAPPKPIATADQVDITQPNTTLPPPQEIKPPIPITVQLFPSSPGVKTCRGSSFVDMELPGNASTEPVFTTKDGQCYNLPGTAQCGIFMGNKADGCEAKLFRGERCTAFSNVAVFQDELRPVGGFFASMSIKCGIVPVEPKPLSLGGLGGKMQKPVQGKRSRAARAVDAAMRAG